MRKYAAYAVTHFRGKTEIELTNVISRRSENDELLFLDTIKVRLVHVRENERIFLSYFTVVQLILKFKCTLSRPIYYHKVQGAAK